RSVSYQNSFVIPFALKTELMYFSFAGTNESEVMQVFQACVNNDDVNLLILQFGKRDGETLSEWINDDFSSSAKEKYINSVLRAKGITKLF
nr:hypothetical protein [Bacteroidales bacterium]